MNTQENSLNISEIKSQSCRFIVLKLDGKEIDATNAYLLEAKFDQLVEFLRYFSLENIKDWLKFLRELNSKRKVANRILNFLPIETQFEIRSLEAANYNIISSSIKNSLIKGLNKIIENRDFYEATIFKNIHLPSETKGLLEKLNEYKKKLNEDRKLKPQFPKKDETIYLNRMLIENAFPEFLIKPINKVVVDFETVEYISSAGIGIFSSHLKDFKVTGGNIKFSTMQRDVYEVYELLEFYKIIEHHQTWDDALKSYFSLDSIPHEVDKIIAENKNQSNSSEVSSESEYPKHQSVDTNREILNEQREKPSKQPQESRKFRWKFWK